jgi:outer membrane protein TolC
VALDRPLALADAIAIALEHQPQVAISDASLQAATARLRQERSALFPDLSIRSAYSKSGPGGSLTTGGAFTTSLSSSLLLYDFGKTGAAISRSGYQRESERQALAQMRQDVINRVKQAYYTLLQNEQLVEVQRQNLASQQSHLDEAKARFGVGLVPRSDVVKGETTVAEAVLSLVTAQNTAALSRVNLNVTMGIDVRTPVQVAETAEAALNIDATTLVDLALAARPDARQAEEDVRAAEAALAAARASNRPSVYADGSYGLQGASFASGDDSWSYGISLQWPLFDGGLTRGRVEEARANLRSAQAQQRNTNQTVSSEVVQAYLNVRSAEEKVIAAEAEATNAEESLRLASGRYQAGVGIYIEVTDAQTALVTAQTNRVNALYGLSLARAELARALGQGE